MSKRKKKKKAKVLPLRRKLSLKNYIKKVARKLPIDEVLISEGFLESGTANIIVTRRKENGQLVFGGYLIDSFCLGLTDSQYQVIDTDIYQDLIDGMNEIDGLNLIPVEPNYAFNYIYGSIEYADDNGFEPHKDFHITKYILDDIDSIDYVDIEFGKNGKPLYVMSEDENNERNLHILNKVVGEGNYEIEVEEPLFDDFEDMDFDMTIEEMIKELLNEEEELKFKTYISGMIILDELYQGAEDELKDAYMNDQIEIINRCHLKLGESEDDTANEEKNLLNFWMPLVENYLIHGDYEFLYLPLIVKSFQNFNEENTDLGFYLMNYLLHTSGREKFDIVLSTLAIKMSSEDPKQNLKEDLRELMDAPPDKYHELEQSQYFELAELVIFNYIKLYEKLFGKISLDEIDLSNSDLISIS